MTKSILIPTLFAAAVYAKAKPQSSNSACSPVELVIARGTTEPGPLGVIVGDPLFNDTKEAIPGATAYAVNYPASFDSDSLPKGVSDVISHIQSASSACPDQKFAMVGYSQGAEVMHEALNQIDTKFFDQMVALVMYGDPGNKGRTGASMPFPAELANKLKENCAQGDPVCTNDGLSAEAHLSYVQANLGFHSSSAQFIKEQVDTDGKAGPDPSSTPVGTGNDSACGLMSLASLLGRPTQPNTMCPSGSGTATVGGGNGSAAGTVAASGTVVGTVAASNTAEATGSSGSGSSGSGAAPSSTAGSEPTQSVTESGANNVRSGGIIGALVWMVLGML